MKSPLLSSPPQISRRYAIQSLLGLLLGAGSFTSIAQPRNFEVAATYAIFDAPLPSHQLKRFSLVSDRGYAYEIFMAIPKMAPQNAGHAILYMLDGNAVFDRLTPQMLAQVPDMVVAGIGYPTPYVHDVVARSRDYTPAVAQGAELPRNAGARPTGEAGYFLEFMQGALRSRVEQDLIIDASRRAIWGHSYGGLFCLYALLRAPDVFSTYLAVSPSVSWGDHLLQGLAQDAPLRRSNQAAKVLVMLGDQERRRNTSAQQRAQASVPNPATLSLVETLQQRRDLNVYLHVLHGLGHGATFRASFPYALAAV